MKFWSHKGQLSDSKTAVRKSCAIEWKAAAKSKYMAPPSSEAQAAWTDASSISNKLDNMERPPMKPR
eukprot:6684178-Pyramimonas_sp.AAC.1